jgi:hypothetical protein
VDIVLSGNRGLPFGPMRLATGSLIAGGALDLIGSSNWARSAPESGVWGDRIAPLWRADQLTATRLPQRAQLLPEPL